MPKSSRYPYTYITNMSYIFHIDTVIEAIDHEIVVEPLQ